MWSSLLPRHSDIERPEQSLVGIASTASQGAITAAPIETRPIMRASEALWNGEIGSRLSRATTRVVLELFNIFDAKVSDIDYFYM
jgi:hypothetical protein